MLNLAGALPVAAADDAPPPRPRSTHEHVFLEAAAKERGAKALLKKSIVATPNQELFDVHHYFLDMTINYDASLLTNTVTTTAEVVGDSISELELNMYSGLTIVSAIVDGSPAVGYSRIPGDDMITVLLGRTYFQGETVAVGVKYQVDALWLNGAGHFNWSSYNGQTMISTYSEPDGAHTWWPCKDVISDKADSLDFRLNVPEGVIVASNGSLVTEFNFGDWHRYYWKTSYPISTYLVSLAIYPYETYSDWYTPLAGGDPMEVPFYVFPDHMDSVQTTYAQTVPMLEAFAAVYGEYPFLDEKYGHAEFLEGGGMEHQTIRSLGGWDEDLIAHEAAHQWWGNMVTCADHSHIWLNEGMAMWSEAYWMGERYGFEEYKAHLAGISYFGPGTVIVEDPANEDIYFYGLTYFKAGWVIHMLRGVLGDTDFFAGLAQYRANHAYGHATTADLQAAMETASGRDLTTFFQQWIYEEYFPVYRMSWIPGPGAGEITVTIDQTQENGGLFEMPVPLRIVSDVSTTDVKVENNQLSQQFVIPVDGTVSAAGFIERELLFQAKGLHYSISDLLVTNLAEANAYVNGRFATIYLAPYNYHRVHAPLGGTIRAARYVPGDLFSVNASTVSKVSGLFVRNERLICHFESNDGPYVLIFVGALNVGSISTPWTGVIRPEKRGVVTECNLSASKVSKNIEKGSLLGWFNMGSTIIMLMQGESVEWSGHLIPGKTLRMGEGIGRLTPESDG